MCQRRKEWSVVCQNVMVRSGNASVPVYLAERCVVLQCRMERSLVEPFIMERPELSQCVMKMYVVS